MVLVTLASIGVVLGLATPADAEPAFDGAADGTFAAREASPPAPPASPILPLDTVGIFTEEQSAAGKDLYEVQCSFCHGAREFAGNIFQRRWLTPPVSGIFAHILNTMPQDAPGSLAPDQVAAIVAYILELNGQPAGSTPLPVEMDKLAQIRVPTGSGPEPERR
jgi:mono/diheme cytochrome c family protein